MFDILCKIFQYFAKFCKFTKILQNQRAKFCKILKNFAKYTMSLSPNYLREMIHILKHRTVICIITCFKQTYVSSHNLLHGVIMLTLIINLITLLLIIQYTMNAVLIDSIQLSNGIIIFSESNNQM